MRDPIIAGYVETLRAFIGCPHCHQIYGEAVESNKEYAALTRTLVCRSCFRRFLKPRIPGWYEHPSGVTFGGNSRATADRGQGETRGTGSQGSVDGHTARRLSNVVIDAARRFGEALRSSPSQDELSRRHDKQP